MPRQGKHNQLWGHLPHSLPMPRFRGRPAWPPRPPTPDPTAKTAWRSGTGSDEGLGGGGSTSWGHIFMTDDR